MNKSSTTVVTADDAHKAVMLHEEAKKRSCSLRGDKARAARAVLREIEEGCIVRVQTEDAYRKVAVLSRINRGNVSFYRTRRNKFLAALGAATIGVRGPNVQDWEVENIRNAK